MARAESEHGLPTRLIVGLILAAALLVVVSFAAGRLGASAAETPTSVSAEAGFARDMQTHHLQAVELSRIVREATDDRGHPAARLRHRHGADAAGRPDAGLAERVGAAAGIRGTVDDVDDPAARSSGHGHGGTAPSTHVAGRPMPGMATEAQLARAAVAHRCCGREALSFS